MPRRPCLSLALLLPALFLCAGCAVLRLPDHLTVFVERDEAETGGGAGRGGSRTCTSKAGVSATYDLHPR